jgi:OCT family organic cation transporter-like MFS transporter 18
MTLKHVDSISLMRQQYEIELNKINKDHVLAIIYINIILYALCYNLQRPLEPFLVEKLVNNDSNSSYEYAKLQSFFSVVQTVGSLIAGRFLDSYGPRLGFIINFLSSALSYYLLSISKSISILYMSKIPTVFQAGYLCGQLAVTQLTKSGEERVMILGRLAMSYTVGSVLGNIIGGYIGSSKDYYFAAKIAVFGSLISVILSLSLPTYSDFKHYSSSRNNIEDYNDNDLSDQKQKENFWQKLKVPEILRSVWLLLFSKVITSVANAMGQAAFPLILKNTYQLNEKSVGLSMSALSGFNAVINGSLLGKITTLLGSKLLAVISNCMLLLIGLSIIQAALAAPSVEQYIPGNGLYTFMASTAVLSVFQYVIATSITSESTSRVDENSKGTLLGLEHCLFAAARVFAPQTGVFLLQYGGITAVSSASSLVFFGVYMIWSTFKHQLNESKTDGSITKQKDFQVKSYAEKKK